MKECGFVKRGRTLLLLAAMLVSLFAWIPAVAVGAAEVPPGTVVEAAAEGAAGKRSGRELKGDKIRLDPSLLPARQAGKAAARKTIRRDRLQMIGGSAGFRISPQWHENTIPALVVEEDSIWYGSDGAIQGDLYVAPDTILVIAGDAVLEGDLYNYGVVIIEGVLDAEYVYSNRYPEGYPDLYANGDLILDPAYQSMVYVYEALFPEDIPGLPLAIYSGSEVNRNGYLPLVQGAVLPFVELSLDAGPVALYDNGSFTRYGYSVGSAAAVTFQMVDPFGNAFSYRMELSRGTYPKPALTVVAGSNRYRTAQAISSALYEAADTAVLVKAQDFPDALAAGPLAHAAGAPILLTNTDDLPAVTGQELARLGVEHVIIMGGTAVISETVENELKASYTTERIAGPNRYTTALAAAERLIGLGGEPTSLIMTSGVNFPDALSAGSYAAIHGFPLLLSNGVTLHERDLTFINEKRVERVVLMGGETAISKGIENDLKARGLSVERIAGSNREGTSSEMAYRNFPGASHAVVASGYHFVDALAAIPYAAALEAPILLVKADRLSSSIENYLERAFIREIRVIGGDAVVSPALRDLLLDAMQ